ncbi:enhanced serine sensitivity protein SseB [Streptomyces sp. JJ66]|uniref:enhanced serine sensitivity protein SseB C-terminal domain-containing protein n=1 Tax=Streptomyces sp. JJ66 TaxID=2803843 RepID=UPI001C5A1274|nr:enhanced serine sensitivity protein SseB C-terminal domain-containing protein [Streptomyces sp. JJ66]MBW1601556.1 enhanced serine sensitivity protein SseB [Streptomyces sp. JJ66]
MTVPEQYPPSPLPHPPHGGGGWPGNELEQTLAVSVGVPGAGGRLLEVLGRSSVYVPLPEGGGPDSRDLNLPTVELEGAAYVPVYSSQEQLLHCVRMAMPFAVVPVREFVRGLPPHVGVVVNPEGTVAVPLPPEAVAELAREPEGVPGVPRGARMRLYEPDWQDDPVDFLTAAAAEFTGLPHVRAARRGLASAEGDPPALFVGVELDLLEPAARASAHDALARALAGRALRWPVQLILMDAAPQDPVVSWLRECVRPFYTRPH